jgi:cytosine deaminase
MTFDLLFRHACLPDQGDGVFDVALQGNRIVEIARHITCDDPGEDLAGKLLFSGFVDSHVHLDKSCISGRCNCTTGTLQEAIAETARAKRGFTEEDIYARGKRTLEKAITQGTNFMRTQVEIDPRIGLKGFHAIRRLKHDFAWAIDLQICVFPQEGLYNDPGTDELLWQACENGADLIGGCPYTDTEPTRHIARIFEIARNFDFDIDFHLDFSLDPSKSDLEEVCRQTAAHRYGGRVAVGHVTNLSALTLDRFEQTAQRLANTGVAVTVLPSTDLFLMGRGRDHLVPRGVTPVHRLLQSGVHGSLATNNVLNPFTPYGDCSMIRMANLYANIVQIGDNAGLNACFDLVSTKPAQLMRLKHYGIAIGHPADLVVVDADDKASAVAEISAPLFGYKNGRRSFARPRASLSPPKHSPRY